MLTELHTHSSSTISLDGVCLRSKICLGFLLVCQTVTKAFCCHPYIQYVRGRKAVQAAFCCRDIFCCSNWEVCWLALPILRNLHRVIQYSGAPFCSTSISFFTTFIIDTALPQSLSWTHWKKRKHAQAPGIKGRSLVLQCCEATV